MAQIILSAGRVALIDDDDLERVSAFKWSYSPNGYAIRGYGPRESRGYQTLHRFIMNEPKGHVDHVNGDKLDCRKSNLRDVRRSQNARNSNPKGRPSSGRRGVYWDQKKKGFQVIHRENGKMEYLGFSVDLATAIAIRERFEESRPDLYPSQADANWRKSVS